MKCMVQITLILSLYSTTIFSGNSPIDNALHKAMSGHVGAFVMVDLFSGSVSVSDSAASADRLTPCSTFKIWNTLFGLEQGIISSSDENFYTWDGEERSITAWNRDLTVREAFVVSCVPAYQNLARRIGEENMKRWIDVIGYGDQDISSGLDIFWLPREGKKSIMISPKEQALMIAKLLNGELPVSATALSILRDVSMFKKSSKGNLYGKTGSGTIINGGPKINIGWYIGFVESGKRRYSYACVVKGENVTSKDAREIVEVFMVKNKLL